MTRRMKPERAALDVLDPVCRLSPILNSFKNQFFTELEAAEQRTFGITLCLSTSKESVYMVNKPSFTSCKPDPP